MVEYVDIMTAGGPLKVRSLGKTTVTSVFRGHRFSSVIHVIPIRTATVGSRVNAILSLTHETSGLSVTTIDADVVAQFCDGRSIDYVAMAKCVLSIVADRVGPGTLDSALARYDLKCVYQDDDIPF